MWVFVLRTLHRKIWLCNLNLCLLLVQILSREICLKTPYTLHCLDSLALLYVTSRRFLLRSLFSQVLWNSWFLFIKFRRVKPRDREIPRLMWTLCVRSQQLMSLPSSSNCWTRAWFYIASDQIASCSVVSAGFCYSSTPFIPLLLFHFRLELGY